MTEKDSGTSVAASSTVTDTGARLDPMEVAKDIRQDLMMAAFAGDGTLMLPKSHLAIMARHIRRAIDNATAAAQASTDRTANTDETR